MRRPTAWPATSSGTLADEAVEARPPSAGYRLGKFLKAAPRPRCWRRACCCWPWSGASRARPTGLIRTRATRVEADEARDREAERAEGERQAKEREAEQRSKAEKARDRTRQALDAMTSSVTGDSLWRRRRRSAMPEQKQFLTEVLGYYREFAGEKGDDEIVAELNGGGGLPSGRSHRGPPWAERREAAATLRPGTRRIRRRLAADFAAVPKYRRAIWPSKPPQPGSPAV